MNLLSAQSLSKSYHDKSLFKDITLGISQGNKIALVGDNGVGKSTLLKILLKSVEPDSGKVVYREGIKIGQLVQQPQAQGDWTVEQILFDDGNEVAAAVKKYEHLLQDPSASVEAMQEALEKMEVLDAWEYEAQVKEITGKLGITQFDQRFETLSGGQRKRTFLAKLLLNKPDILVLDEPTNHLDIEAIEWLENYLSHQQITLLMVTHDRYFLDQVANVIIEIDRGQLFTYKGNYAYFLEKKTEREEALQASVDKAKNLLRKELEWMRKQPKARGTKAKYRVEAFYELKEKASINLKKERLALDVSERRQGSKIMELEDIRKAYGEKKIMQNFSYVFKKGDRIGIVGKNGVGKSTFLDILTGKSQPDGGKIECGQTTHIGYFTQDAFSLNPAHRVIEEVKAIAEFITLADGSQLSASKFLESFLFTPEKQYTFIEKLSGGEKKRLHLLKTLIQNPNFLILDEPTNDFDIDTLNALEDFLDKFSGCLLIVSHDRYFMDRLANQLFVFEGEGVISIFNGNYSDYRMSLDDAKEVKAPLPPHVVKSSDTKSKASSAEKKELERLSVEIEALETRKNEIEAQLSQTDLPYASLQSLTAAAQSILSTIEVKTQQWLILSEKMEK